MFLLVEHRVTKEKLAIVSENGRWYIWAKDKDGCVEQREVNRKQYKRVKNPAY